VRVPEGDGRRVVGGRVRPCVAWARRASQLGPAGRRAGRQRSAAATAGRRRAARRKAAPSQCSKRARAQKNTRMEHGKKARAGPLTQQEAPEVDAVVRGRALVVLQDLGGKVGDIVTGVALACTGSSVHGIHQGGPVNKTNAWRPNRPRGQTVAAGQPPPMQSAVAECEAPPTARSAPDSQKGLLLYRGNRSSQRSRKASESSAVRRSPAETERFHERFRG
jgi:hypothetical protein